MEAPVQAHEDEDSYNTLSNKLAEYITCTHTNTHTTAAHLYNSHKETSKKDNYTHCSTHINTVSSCKPVTLVCEKCWGTNCSCAFLMQLKLSIISLHGWQARANNHPQLARWLQVSKANFFFFFIEMLTKSILQINKNFKWTNMPRTCSLWEACMLKIRPTLVVWFSP